MSTKYKNTKKKIFNVFKKERKDSNKNGRE